MISKQIFVEKKLFLEPGDFRTSSFVKIAGPVTFFAIWYQMRISNFRIQKQIRKISSRMSYKSLKGVFLGHPVDNIEHQKQIKKYMFLKETIKNMIYCFWYVG